MSQWSKEFREAYNKSEVFAEYEKAFLEKIKLVDNFTKNAQNLVQQTQSVQQLNKAVSDATPKIKEFNQALNSADDGQAEDFDMTKSVDSEEKVDYDKILQHALGELDIMKEAAFQESNMKLVYKIERTIDELLDIKVMYEDK